MITILLMSAGGVWSSANSFADTVSDSMIPFLIAGELVLALDHDNGKEKAVQGAKALLVTDLATNALKMVIRDKRPNSDSRDSFPSGHTSLTFTMATVLSDYKPEYTIPAYGMALLMGWSRVESGEHHWYDVIAGAILGYSIAKRYTGQHLTVTPEGLTYNWKF